MWLFVRCEKIASIAPAPAPIFSPSTTVINFPAQEVGGTTAEQVLTITNSGNSALTFGAITPTATFTISSNTCTSVAPAMTCTLGLTFSPTFVGPVMGSLVINTPGAGGPHFISLNGIGTTPTTAIAPAGISHGSVTVGSSN